MSYEDEWTWWLEEACYRVARGVSLLSIPSEVSPDGWEQIEKERERLEAFHRVCIFRGDFVTDDLGTAAEVCVARYPWVRGIYERSFHSHDGDVIAGLLLGYSAEAIDDFLTRNRGGSP